MKNVVDIANIDFYLYDFWGFNQEIYTHLKKSGELYYNYMNSMLNEVKELLKELVFSKEKISVETETEFVDCS
jgi:hypothetical protein